jgi:hypothetical protein
MRSGFLALTLVVCLGASAATAGAQPHIANATLTKAAVQGSLARTLDGIAARGGVTWVGYAVPGNGAGSDACCHAYRDRVLLSSCCTLERDVAKPSGTAPTAASGPPAPPRTVHLEPSPDVSVFIRFESGQANRIAAYGADCDIDAGGRPVVWLTGVTPAESLAWLTRPASGAAGAPTDGAVTAIAFHADPAADGILETLARTTTGRGMGVSAAFWLGAARGSAGYAALVRLLSQITGDKAREQLVFALSISKDERALGTLFDLAKHDTSPGTRGQALFWIGQKAGAKAAGTLTDAVANDPDTEVKTRAVFALSQLPKDEGIPRLIDVASTNRNPAVRKQAMFWLGQSKDPRALAFFEEILSRR